MNIVKTILLDVVLVAVLLIPAVIVGIIVKTNSSSDCMFCGVAITFTLWFIAVFALQPVLWFKGLSKKSRLTAWSIATFGGISVEVIAMFVFTSGWMPTALSIGFLPYPLGEISALVFSVVLVRRATKHSQQI